jgi:hypothetical protein
MKGMGFAWPRDFPNLVLDFANPTVNSWHSPAAPAPAWRVRELWLCRCVDPIGSAKPTTTCSS